MSHSSGVLGHTNYCLLYAIEHHKEVSKHISVFRNNRAGKGMFRLKSCSVDAP
jgi:hypothetical protein